MIGKTVPRDLHDDLQRRYDELLEKYHALVQEVVDRTPKPPEAVEIKYDEPDEAYPVPDSIKEAIWTYSEPDSREALRTQEVAYGMLRQGISEEDVVALVHQGEHVLT